MTLKTKFRVMIGVSAAGLLAVAAFWIQSEHSSLLSGKLQKTKNLVEVPFSVIEHQYQLETEGKISRSEAQRQATEADRLPDANRQGNRHPAFAARGKAVPQRTRGAVAPGLCLPGAGRAAVHASVGDPGRPGSLSDRRWSSGLLGYDNARMHRRSSSLVPG